MKGAGKKEEKEGREEEGCTYIGSLLFSSPSVFVHVYVCPSVCAGSRWERLHICVGWWQWWQGGRQLQL